MKGIVLAGGLGTRQGLLTKVINKHFLPVYDRPMIFYPILTLRAMGVTEVLVISRPEDRGKFFCLLSEEPSLSGLAVSFTSQQNPRGGIAEALTIGAAFTLGEPVVLVLGDQLFWGPNLVDHLGPRAPLEHGARIFVQEAGDLGEFGVVDLDADGRPVAIEEKPASPRSSGLAVTGLYAFDGRAAGFARELRPSARGELEIVDVIRRYLEAGELEATVLPQTVRWMDLGTPDRLLDAANFLRQETTR